MTGRLLASALLVCLTGCGAIPQHAGGAGPTSTTDTAPTTSDPRVLYEGDWLVTEGVWQIGPEGAGLSSHGTDGLLAPAGDRTLTISGPALYGKYPVRVLLFSGRPETPTWCQDVAVAPLEVGRASLVMASFDTFSEPMQLDPGSYRVRLCARGLDAAARETADDEFDGDDYRTYSCRLVLQVWRAPVTPARVVRAASRFARSLQG